MGKTLNIPAVALRYQNVYGPGQSLANPYTGILSIFSTRLLNGNDIDIYEDGEESRDFVFIDDVVDATVLSLEKKEANNQIFNVGSGVAITVSQVANTLKSLYTSDVEIKVSGKYRLGDIRHNYADLSKIKDKYDKSITELRSKGFMK
jgi:dTDP-L-rhamnose 4-epimerase